MENFYTLHYSNCLNKLRKDYLFIFSALTLFFFLALAIFAPLISGVNPIIAKSKDGSLKFPAFNSNPGTENYKWAIYPINPYDENKRDIKCFSSPPGKKHFFGTDQIGRDVFARVIYGTRAIMKVGFYSTFFSMIIGFFIGFIIAWDSIIATVFRLIISIFNTLPPFLLLIIVITLNGRSLENVIIAIVISRWGYVANAIGNWCKYFISMEFVQAAQIMGRKSWQIFIKHLIPNLTEIFLILILVTFSFSILMEVSLSFLGLGIKPPTPSWGTLIAESWDQIISGDGAWWMAFFPCIMLAILFVSLNIFIEKLNFAFNPEKKMLIKK
ncbi:ABC transporter permease [bacterium]|nr:ABC transporter permease [bacterium]